MAEYNFQEIEKKWQQDWKKQDIYKVDLDKSKPKYYILDMFPYPSGAGLHVGHPLGYIASDIVSRFKRLKGFNVLHPMGYDSFGLPAEQHAILTGQHPAITTKVNIDGCLLKDKDGNLSIKPEFIDDDGYVKREALLPTSKELKVLAHNDSAISHVIRGYRFQLDELGFSYDWSREVRTSDPSFYKWTQWIFKLIYNSWYNQETDKAEHIDKLISTLEKEGNSNVKAVCDEDTPVISADDWKGFSEKEQSDFLSKYRLTYLAETSVNWCPALGTVLSNDEVKDGFSERGGHPVVKKKMPQWNMRITAYADRLLKGLDTIDWPEPIKEIQRNWIGKSTGSELNFAIDGHDESIQVFTTRIDTIFGATFAVLAPEHELIEKITTPEQKAKVEAYVNEAINRSERERMSDVKKVSGVFTGAYAINPFSNERIPIWTADYVLAGYGTGAVMAVPAHDERDHRFAKQFGLKIKQVIAGDVDVKEEAFTSKDAEVINSDFLNGLKVKDAIEKAIAFAEEKGFGKAKVNFRLRDAIFGRQRYWGEPIPVYYKDGVPHLVEDDRLPLNLPEVSEYLPTEDGDPPLGRAKDWNHDGHSYELSTMPGWAGSSWYFFRYMDPDNDKEFCSKEALDYWSEVDFYLGGSEHATGHLLYSRFWTKFLYDLGYVKVEEFAKKLVNQGMIQGRSNFVYRINFVLSFSGNWSDEKLSEIRKKIPPVFVSKGVLDKALNTDHHNKLPELIEIQKEINENLPNGISVNYRIDILSTSKLNVDVSLVRNDILDQKNLTSWSKGVEKAKYILEEDGTYLCGWEIEKMSKSKFNVVNPDDLVQQYGADTLRMYEMFLGPIEQSKPWNTNGIDGVFKFLRKFWNLFHDGDSFVVSDDEPTKEEMKVLHGLIKKVQDDCESLSLNTSISAFMIATNELGALKCNKRAILEPMTILLAPFAPHISEELYHLLGNEASVVDATFPKFEEKYMVEDSFEYPISINGKTRTKIFFPADASKEDIETGVLADEVVQKWTEGKAPKKVIVVPKRIVNVVV